MTDEHNKSKGSYKDISSNRVRNQIRLITLNSAQCFRDYRVVTCEFGNFRRTKSANFLKFISVFSEISGNLLINFLFILYVLIMAIMHLLIFHLQLSKLQCIDASQPTGEIV